MPNVLYVTIDSIRIDRVGYAGGSGQTTPVIDSLAAEGTAFDHAVANGIPTYYSFKSLMGGIQSLSHTRDIGLPRTATSLAEVFERAGYTTGGFNAKNPWLTPSYGYNRGFHTYRDFIGNGDSRLTIGRLNRRAKQLAKRAVGFSDELTDTLGLLGRTAHVFLGAQPLKPAEPVTDAAIGWLESVDDRPFFLWVHYMDPHYPWIPPKKHLKADDDKNISRIDISAIWHTVADQYQRSAANIDPETLSQIERLYDAEVRRTDAAIGRLLDAIEESEKGDETIVVVAGDHGTELHDHGGFSHGPRTLYDEVLRVPLVFHGPSVPREQRSLAALVDVPQTIVGLVDAIRPPETFEGTNLFRNTRSNVVSEVVFDYEPAHGRNKDNGLLQACTAPPWKYIRNQERGQEELYDLAADPKEDSPVTNESDTVEALSAVLDDHREVVERRNRTMAEKLRVRRRVAELRSAGEI